MDPLTQRLNAMLGPGATFRDGKREAISATELVAIAARSGRKVAAAAAPYEQAALFDDLTK